MKIKTLIPLLLCLAISITAFSQAKHIKSQTKSQIKSDSALFYHQIVALKEYKSELKKLPKLSKENGKAVKIKIEIDAMSQDVDDDADAKNTIITGYIKEDFGDMVTEAYQISFDTVTKKITSIVCLIEKDIDVNGKEPE